MFDSDVEVSIAAAKDTMISSPSTDQVLRYDGLVAKWKNSSPETAGMSLKAWEDATRAITATHPSTESGLTAIAANASTDDAPRINAMLVYIKTTYGGGRLYLPTGKTSNCNATITIPAGVQVVGSQTSRWDFWYAGSSVTAVIVNDNDFTPIIGLKITGNQYEANASTHNTTTSTGLNITGHGLNFIDVQIGGFNWGVDCTNDNTYIISFERSAFLGCMVALNLDMANAWGNAANAVNNSGERIVFTDCVIANCGTAYWATGNGTGLYFTHTSIDFTTLYGRQQNAHVFFSNCHLETTGSADNLAYLFDLSGNPRLYMVNCGFITGAAGVYSVISAANGPWNYGVGMAHFTNCYAQFSMTPAASVAGAVSSGFSESVVAVPQNATSITVASFFVTKWNSIKVNVVATDGGAAANLSARISGMSIPNGTVTVSLSTAAPAGTFIELTF